MMQMSIYSKVCLNMNAANIISASVRRHKPSAGLVQLMIITEQQFARMEFISGERDETYIQNDERLVIL
jgi:CRISPR-associated protein Cas2